MNAKRGPSVMKSTVRAASGGALAIVALLALMFMQNGGDGQGDAEAPEVPNSTTPLMTSTEAPVKPTLASLMDDSAPGGLTSDEQEALSTEVLTLLIDEYQYLMQIPTAAETLYRPVELDRAVELAEQADGDNNGIRVRILRRDSSRASAEHDLVSRLQQAGISEDAIYMPSEFVP